MGLSALRSRPGGNDQAPAELPPARRSFWIGVVTNLLNPKAALFFVALFSAVLASSTALGLGHPRVRAKLQARAWQIDRAMGGLLVLLALPVLLG